MFTDSRFELKKAASAALCTVLFSATLLLSAVGPAEAVDASPVPAQLASPALSLAVAPLA